MNELEQSWFNVAVKMGGTSGKLEHRHFMIDCPLNIRRQSNVAVINLCQSLIIIKKSHKSLYHSENVFICLKLSLQSQ